MKISDLISILAEYISDNGDIDVYLNHKYSIVKGRADGCTVASELTKHNIVIFTREDEDEKCLIIKE